jgi:hypothetical protein
MILIVSVIDPTRWCNQRTAMRKDESQNKSIPKVRVRTGVKAGGAKFNHGLRIRTRVRAGDGNGNGPGPILQHGVRVRTGVKAGPFTGGVGGGSTQLNHGVRVRQPAR